MTVPSKTPLLDLVKTPSDLRHLEEGQLRQLADELRRETIDAVSVTGGHLGAGLGVVELTVALHYVFDTPRDRLVWDVGHQAYPHKILTGRRDRIRTLRQGGGLSGFTKRAESEYDPFGAAHSSTSISAALGMAVARDLSGKKNNVIAVIGDGAMSAGMAYEAMNNAGAINSRLIVVLNDNDMSIAPPVGALSAYLARRVSGRGYRSLRHIVRQIAKRLPSRMLEKRALAIEEYARGLVTGGTLFDELGFFYVGPIDGHNIDHLLPVLKNVRDAENGPFLVHVVTKKGKGYAPAEKSADKYHGVVKFDVATGAQVKSKPTAPAYQKVYGESLIKEARKDPKIVAITAAMPSGTGVDLFEKEFPERTFDVGIAEQHGVTFAAGLATEGFKPFATIYSTFLQRAYDQVVHDVATGAQVKSKPTAPAYQKVYGESLIKEARKDPKIVAITAAMPSGTGIDLFQKEFPKRTFDVGIAEQHGVTFAAGLATEGFKPFATIYSTFLQRAYDQVVHDVAIQRLPVRFAMDRAGLVGADGPTHAGTFDVAYLGCLPGFVLMAAADEAELVHMVSTAVAIDDRPSALRYPRGEGRGVPMPEEGRPLEIGKGRILREGTKVALFSYGARLGECLKAADELAAHGLSTTVADARFAKPLDVDLLLRLSREHEVLLTIEEGSIGGFGSFVLQALAEHGLLDRGLKVRSMVLPDIFIDQDSPNAMYAKAGLDAKGIVHKAFEALGQNIRGEAVKLVR